MAMVLHSRLLSVSNRWKTKRLKSKQRFTSRSRSVQNAAKAVHARSPSPFLCIGTICYFVHIHNAVTSSRTDAFSRGLLLLSFPPSPFPPVRTRTSSAGYCSSIPVLSRNFDEGFNIQLVENRRDHCKLIDNDRSQVQTFRSYKIAK